MAKILTFLKTQDIFFLVGFKITTEKLKRGLKNSKSDFHGEQYILMKYANTATSVFGMLVKQHAVAFA